MTPGVTRWFGSRALMNEAISSIQERRAVAPAGVDTCDSFISSQAKIVGSSA